MNGGNLTPSPPYVSRVREEQYALLAHATADPAVRLHPRGARRDAGQPFGGYPHEVALRSELHRRGLRFRKHVALVPGVRFRPDVVFPRQRIVVECLGCFWHRCPLDGVTPRTNSRYWRAKLEGNVLRDERNAKAVADAGWQLIVVWEHEDLVAAADRIEALVRSVAACA